MTTYSVASLGNAQIAYKKGITLQQLRQLRDNIIALAEGDGTAPDISRLALATATNSVSGSIAAAATLRINMDPWSFAPDIRGGAGITFVPSTGTQAADTPGFSLTNTSGGSATYGVAWRRLAV